jgi:hypothetical protein
VALRTGFVRFLIETKCTEVGLNDLSPELVNAYIKWLNQPKGNSARWAVRTRYIKYNAFTALIGQLRITPAWSAQCKDLVLPRNVWPGIGIPGSTVAVLDADLLKRMRRAAMKEALETIENFNQTQKIINSFTGTLPPLEEFGRGDLMKVSMPEFLVRLNSYKKDGYFSYHNIPRQIRLVARYLQVSVSGLAHHFYPTPRAMVPFVLLFGLAHFFNADTVRTLKLDDFRYVKGVGSFFGAELDPDGEGGETLAANAKKGRANRRQRAYVPVDEEVDNPAFLFEFIKTWTAEIREFAVLSVSRNLFLYAAPSSEYRISSYHGIDGTSLPENWRTALASFCEEHGLESFTLSSVRKSALDVAFELFDGDLKAVSEVANHAHIGTTMAYMSAMEKARNLERLGNIIQVRSRSIETSGKIDYRDFSQEQDINCATPGWHCSDPNDSPFSEKGKLCSAGGFCPACHLGTPDFNSPLSFAYSINLLDAINRSQLTMNPENWLARLGPVKHRLENFWLPGFPSHVVEEAKKIDLPAMPSPE